MAVLKPHIEAEIDRLRENVWEHPLHRNSTLFPTLPVVGAPPATWQWWPHGDLVAVVEEAALVLRDYGWSLEYCTHPSGLVYLQATHNDCKEEAVPVCGLSFVRVEGNSLEIADVWQDDAVDNVRALPAFVAHLISQGISHAD